jgi:hypothetical protein
MFMVEKLIINNCTLYLYRTSETPRPQKKKIASVMMTVICSVVFKFLFAYFTLMSEKKLQTSKMEQHVA